ncbi:hypothetical protein J3E68DRAFT_448853 [Trichoderma sp. SZMC 28012]
MTQPPDPQARRRAISGLPYYLPGSPKCISEITKAIDSILSPKGPLEGLELKEICSMSFEEISHSHQPIDFMFRAAPERYRLIDCSKVIHDRSLRIVEFIDFPKVSYAALSYVWRGNFPTEGPKLETLEFSVLGAEDADPLGLDVLFDACTAAVTCGASFIWLDRLCIMQTSKKDKTWQIREMYRIYAFAIVSIVIPGGLRALVPLIEETQWINRAWTLQEVVAPPSSAVLFAWNLTAGEIQMKAGGEQGSEHIEIVTLGRSAMVSLDTALSMCLAGSFMFIPSNAKGASPSLQMKSRLFGEPQDNHQIDHIPTTIMSPTDSMVHLPHVSALIFAINLHLDTEEMREFCIWQCAFVRTSSRPVDMVFSVMGLLGVVLDPAAFDANDRPSATIALAREILAQGRSASWLGISVGLPPCSSLSTFPIFPQTSVAGRATYVLPNGDERLIQLTEAVYPNEIGIFPPRTGSMDENGYFTFEALAAVAVASSETSLYEGLLYDHAKMPSKLRAMDGSTWDIHPDLAISDTLSDENIASPRSQSFIVMLGFYNVMPAEAIGNNLRAMIVEEHAKNRYHVRSYFVMHSDALQWISKWKRRSFCVGGPDIKSSIQLLS